MSKERRGDHQKLKMLYLSNVVRGLIKAMNESIY